MTQPASKRFVMEDALTNTLVPINTQLAAVINANKLINGGFDVWQRGTSFTSAGWTADRWKADSLTATTVGRVALASGLGSTYGLTLTATNATNSISLSQPFESININPLRGKTVTLSFDAVATVAATLTHNLQGSTTADNSSASFSTVTGGTGSTLLTTVPVKITRTVTIPSTSASAGFRVNFTTSNIANGAVITIYNVKLEVGTIATAFCHNTDYPTSELQVCQRYFWAMGKSPANTYGHFGTGGSSYSTTNSVFTIALPVEMRTAPTGTVSAASDFQVDLPSLVSAVVTTFTFSPNATANMVPINLQHASNANFGGFKSVAFYANNTLNARIYLSAEI